MRITKNIVIDIDVPEEETYLITSYSDTRMLVYFINNALSHPKSKITYTEIDKGTGKTFQHWFPDDFPNPEDVPSSSILCVSDKVL